MQVTVHEKVCVAIVFPIKKMADKDFINAISKAAILFIFPAKASNEVSKGF